MIPKTEPRWQAQSWQQQLKTIIRSNQELAQYLQLETQQLNLSHLSAAEFPVRVPAFFADLIDRNNPSDPILRQVLAINDEQIQAAGFNVDPLEEQAANPIPGLVHKYKSRILLIISSACAIHCRYCFRRHFAYQDNNPSQAQWQQAVDYVQQQPDINEIIFSGGDPLSAPNKALFELAQQFERLPQITRLRIHSRLPVVIPARIDTDFLQSFAKLKLDISLVLHINHAQEISPQLQQSVAMLKQLGWHIYNQAVLLRGVNDNLKALCDLSEACFSSGIQPYYLHLLDKVQGASHFEVPQARACELVEQMRTELPGYLIPQLAKEEPNKASKTAIL